VLEKRGLEAQTSFMKQIIFTLIIGALAAACATTDSTNPNETEDVSPSATQKALDKAQSGAGHAALSPLEDINLRRDKIPERLKQIKNPYDLKLDLTCEDIESEVVALDALLGRDWDVPPPDKAALKERAADGASTAFLDTLASQASGLIPYRGIVRTVSGANAHSKKVLKAYERGSHRRTFLKGIGYMKGCPYPSSPQELPDDAPDIVFK
jgi:hypothetical protein